VKLGSENFGSENEMEQKDIKES